MPSRRLTGKRHVEVTERRTRKDWANFIKGMLNERYPDAVKVRLVMDNLNTHDVASIYEAFEPAEARRLAARLEIHNTPKHGSWLNIAEIELSALQSQCMNRRIPSRERLQKELFHSIDLLQHVYWDRIEGFPEGPLHETAAENILKLWPDKPQ